jgi:hypothetical protein
MASREPRSHVHFAAPPLIAEIAYDVSSAWQEILAKRAGRNSAQLRELVTETFSSRGTLPSQLLERLTRDPVSTLLSEDS